MILPALTFYGHRAASRAVVASRCRGILRSRAKTTKEKTCKRTNI